MAACDVQTLIAEANCWTCVSPGLQQLGILSLLCRIGKALDPDMSCSPSSLLADAACFSCLSPGMLRLIELQLLCNISNSISGGMTTDAVSCGHGVPVAAPTATCAIYIDLDSTAIYYWDGGNWVLKV